MARRSSWQPRGIRATSTAYATRGATRRTRGTCFPLTSTWGNTSTTHCREDGLAEVLGILDGAMEGKEMIVRFYCLGPRDSVFSQLCCQITDSFYVAHSEDLLYRPGYEEFRKAPAHG